tara:strand:- start:36593 stop:37045 length:453 start_codon:yes stop_codon:yes gene_type:complete
MSFDPFAEFSDAPNPALIEPSDNEVVEINLLKTAEDQLFEAIERTYTKDKLSKQQNFNAVVLVHFIQTQQDIVRNEFRVKARIPELHNLIPVPLGANDMASIVMHPTFTGPMSILKSAGDILLAGTKITVTFGNIDNFTEPKIVAVRHNP